MDAPQPRSPKDVLQPRDVPPPPKKRSTHSRRGYVVVANFVLSCFVLCVVLAVGAFYLGKVQFEQAGPLDTPHTVVIESGSSLQAIAEKLESNDVISSNLIFRLGTQAHRAQANLKPGEYVFNPGMSMQDVMETIQSGKGVVHKVSLPEGLTVHQIFERLAKNEILEGGLPEKLPPEGSLMPDTYPFQRGTTRAQMVERMREAQARFLQTVWDRRVQDLPIETPQDLVTLASIVEKETGRADERPRVASVFINRLNKGMRLQSDPTIIYGIFGGQGKPKDRPIYKSDIEKPTPYNTYTINGLPPTPIANPGRAAMEAVANPSRTDDLFFVANGTGGHVFARTLNEHNRNVARWREIEKQLRANAAEAAKAVQEGEPATQ